MHFAAAFSIILSEWRCTRTPFIFLPVLCKPILNDRNHQLLKNCGCSEWCSITIFVRSHCMRTNLQSFWGYDHDKYNDRN